MAIGFLDTGSAVQVFSVYFEMCPLPFYFELPFVDECLCFELALENSA